MTDNPDGTRCSGLIQVPDELISALSNRITPEMQAKQDAAKARVHERNRKLLNEH